MKSFILLKQCYIQKKIFLVLSFWLSFHETVRDCDKVWLGLNACVLDVLWMRELNLTCTVFIFDLLCQCNLPLRVRQSQLQWFSNDITPDAALSRVKFWKKTFKKKTFLHFVFLRLNKTCYIYVENISSLSFFVFVCFLWKLT